MQDMLDKYTTIELDYLIEYGNDIDRNNIRIELEKRINIEMKNIKMEVERMILSEKYIEFK